MFSITVAAAFGGSHCLATHGQAETQVPSPRQSPLQLPAVVQRRDTQQRVRGATVEGLLASVNGAWETVPAHVAPRVQRVQATPAAPRVVKRQSPRPEELRAAAANRVAKLEEFEAVGFRWSA